MFRVERLDLTERDLAQPGGPAEGRGGIGAFGDAVARAQQPLAAPAVLDARERGRGRRLHRPDVAVADPAGWQDLAHLDEFIRDRHGLGVGGQPADGLGAHHQGIQGDDVPDHVRQVAGGVRDAAPDYHPVAGAGGTSWHGQSVFLRSAGGMSASSAGAGSSCPKGSSSAPGIQVSPASVQPLRLMVFFAARRCRPMRVSV